ncbi:MAG: arsenate reductase ArsC [Betaproteobacteria bacterium]|jgi:arsenate reductase|nr:arsenate reductase ArsC [Betaproteobacteria bacterium]|tara:strand:+ start:334 stop:804 length:471 start_codon:yes stop_codon:yes gene_type:complete
MKKILVLCTGNSCRSIMAEGLINHFGKENFQAFSAGSNPAGYVHPMSIKTLEKSGIFKSDYKSQSWDDFSDIDFDLVITVCDNAAGEACPVYLSSAPKVHWGVEDPAKFEGSEEEIENEFQRIFTILAKRTHAMVEKYSISKKLQLEELTQIGSLV